MSHNELCSSWKGWSVSSSEKRYLETKYKKEAKIDCKIYPSYSGDKILKASWWIILSINEDEEKKNKQLWGEWSWIHKQFWEPDWET